MKKEYDFLKNRLSLFSGEISEKIRKISLAILRIQKNGLTIGNNILLADTEEFLYRHLNELILPYSVSEFVNGKSSDFKGFFLEVDWMQDYQYLGDSILSQLDLSVDNIINALNRFNQDFVLLQSCLGAKNELMHLSSIKFTDADRHNSGQQALVFSIKIGEETKRVLYKPRDMSYLGDLCAALNNEIQVPSVYLCNKDYGWQEYIKYEDAIDIKSYYLAAGKLLAIYSLINGSDAHFENLISTDTSPCIIDWETIFTNTSYFKEQGVDTDLVSFTGLVQPKRRFWELWLDQGLTAGLTSLFFEV